MTIETALKVHELVSDHAEIDKQLRYLCELRLDYLPHTVTIRYTRKDNGVGLGQGCNFVRGELGSVELFDNNARELLDNKINELDRRRQKIEDELKAL